MPPSRFSVRELESQQVPDGYHFTVTTDSPCHLYLRWTLEKPRTHKDPILRRGVYFPEKVRFCFVEYHDNEQEEAADTLAHTFLKQEWPVCETRYFYFWGTVGAEPSPSESPLFTKHFTGVGNYVKSLGKHGEAEVLIGDVKLKEGTGITITRIDDENALEIAAAAAAYSGFGNDFLWYASDESLRPAGTFLYDRLQLNVRYLGDDYRIYTPAHYLYGLDKNNTLEFKWGRHTPTGGTPDIAIGLTAAGNNILDNLTTQGIWFRLTNSDLYAENADGANRTSTFICATDMYNPLWFRWERQATQIQFFRDGILVATHNTNLPTSPKWCVFVYQIKARDTTIRGFSITHPRYKPYP
ncbi:hypothetical protein ES703_85266 [subsurface metagenome]